MEWLILIDRVQPSLIAGVAPHRKVRGAQVETACQCGQTTFAVKALRSRCPNQRAPYGFSQGECWVISGTPRPPCLLARCMGFLRGSVLGYFWRQGAERRQLRGLELEPHRGDLGPHDGACVWDSHTGMHCMVFYRGGAVESCILYRHPSLHTHRPQIPV